MSQLVACAMHFSKELQLLVLFIKFALNLGPHAFRFSRAWVKEAVPHDS